MHGTGELNWIGQYPVTELPNPRPHPTDVRVLDAQGIPPEEDHVCRTLSRCSHMRHDGKSSVGEAAQDHW